MLMCLALTIDAVLMKRTTSNTYNIYIVYIELNRIKKYISVAVIIKTIIEC